MAQYSSIDRVDIAPLLLKIAEAFALAKSFRRTAAAVRNVAVGPHHDMFIGRGLQHGVEVVDVADVGRHGPAREDVTRGFDTDLVPGGRAALDDAVYAFAVAAQAAAGEDLDDGVIPVPRDRHAFLDAVLMDVE